MDSVSVSRFKATCLALLDRVRRTGRPLLVTKRGVPLAQVVPPPTPPPNLDSGHGSMAGTIQLLGDIVEPVGEKDWEVLKD
jgi:prevent-host-death family protein